MMPLRHVELGANMNNSKIAGDATATTVAQMHIYQAMDRLGIGQYLSRIALMLDGSTGAALDESKGYWMDDQLGSPCASWWKTLWWSRTGSSSPCSRTS